MAREVQLYRLECEFSKTQEENRHGGRATQRRADHWHFDTGRSGINYDGVIPTARITEQTHYRCKAKYWGMEGRDAKNMKQLEDKNRKLKHVVAELTLDNR